MGVTLTMSKWCPHGRGLLLGVDCRYARVGISLQSNHGVLIQEDYKARKCLSVCTFLCEIIWVLCFSIYCGQMCFYQHVFLKVTVTSGNLHGSKIYFWIT